MSNNVAEAVEQSMEQEGAQAEAQEPPTEATQFQKNPNKQAHSMAITTATTATDADLSRENVVKIM